MPRPSSLSVSICQRLGHQRISCVISLTGSQHPADAVRDRGVRHSTVGGIGKMRFLDKVVPVQDQEVLSSIQVEGPPW